MDKEWEFKGWLTKVLDAAEKIRIEYYLGTNDSALHELIDHLDKCAHMLHGAAVISGILAGKRSRLRGLRNGQKLKKGGLASRCRGPYATKV